jgi:hypothetical protein
MTDVTIVTPDVSTGWLTVTEAAKVLGVSRQRIHQRIKSGTIEARQEPSSRTKTGFFWAVRVAPVPVSV